MARLSDVVAANHVLSPARSTMFWAPNRMVLALATQAVQCDSASVRSLSGVVCNICPQTKGQCKCRQKYEGALSCLVKVKVKVRATPIR